MNESPVPQGILDAVRQNFGFMFDRGYEIVSSHSGADRDINGWEIELQKQDLLFLINKERGVTNYYFSLSSGSNYRNVNGILYLLTDKKRFFAFMQSSYDMRKYAELIHRYIDTIESYYKEYSKHTTDLNAAEKEFNNSSIFSPKSLLYALVFCGILYFVFRLFF